MSYEWLEPHTRAQIEQAEALSPIYSKNDIKPLFEVMPTEWTAGATFFSYFPLHSKNERTF